MQRDARMFALEAQRTVSLEFESCPPRFDFQVKMTPADPRAAVIRWIQDGDGCAVLVAQEINWESADAVDDNSDEDVALANAYAWSRTMVPRIARYGAMKATVGHPAKGLFRERRSIVNDEIPIGHITVHEFWTGW